MLYENCYPFYKFNKNRFKFFYQQSKLKTIQIGTQYKKIIQKGNSNSNQSIVKNKKQMQGDQLLQQWKKAKQICQKIIQISKNANLYNKVSNVAMQKQTSRQFMSVYDTVYRLCITKEKQQTRVTMVYKDFKDILKNALLSMCQELKNQKDTYKLSYLRKIWEAYCDILKRMIHMFAYLNRPFHIKEGRIVELQKSGMEIIVMTLLNEVAIAQYESIYFRQIDRIRKTNDFSNAQTLKGFVDILYKIHLKLIKNVSKKAITRYTQFYSRFLKISREFYEKKYLSIKQLHPQEYYSQVHSLYKRQTRIATQCFGVGGQSLVNKQFSEQLIQKHRQTFMKSPKGLKAILQSHQLHTLKIIIEMYTKLTKNIDGFREQFQQFIFQDVKAYLQEIKNEIVLKKSVQVYCTFLDKIINKNKEYLNILEESFLAIADFPAYYKAGVQKAFIAVKLPIPIEQILAIYVDQRLKFNSVQQTQVQGTIKNIMHIFVCLENKDLFLMKYTQRLAKRFLTINADTIKKHQQFVQCLKLNCGLKFTQRLQTLFFEYNQHEEHLQIIKKLLAERKVQVDLNVRIFSEGAWPTTYIIDVPLHYLPDSVNKASQCLKIYNEQYNNKKTFKISFLESKFRWTYFFDKESGSKFSEAYFDTNCFQGALLWIIYSKRPQKVNLQVLKHYFQKIPLKLLKQNLNKMVQLAQNILTRSSEGQQTFYCFNPLMKSSKRFITYESGTNTEEERLFQLQDLGKDREIVLDANIAKFMKSKKVTDFQTLFTQITKMIKTYTPQKKDIKIAIERLIGKELLVRDEKDINKIKYAD